MQRIGFGTIEGLIVRDGEPVLDPRLRIIREVKLGAKNGPRAESELDDFVLKAEVVDLFDQFDAFDTEKILKLEVKHGLPFRIQMEEIAA